MFLWVRCHLAISIHALREEGDTICTEEGIISAKFLSTPSARRATGLHGTASDADAISIHALREEGDVGKTRLERIKANFYPRPPRGGRP